MTELHPTVAKPVLIVSGILRSGTTLLHRLLTHSFKSRHVEEVDALHVMIESFQVLESYQAFRPLGRDGYVSLYRQLLESTFNACSREMFGDVVVLKDPMALPTLPLLHELAPQAKFVLSVRNPLSTVTSINRIRLKQRIKGQQSFIAAMDFGDIVEYVARLGAILISMRERTNVHLVRYEDLIQRDPEMLASLSRFVDCKIDTELPDTTPEFGPDHAFWTPEAGRSIQSTSLRKHEAEISPAERELVTTLLRHFSETFGYNGAGR